MPGPEAAHGEVALPHTRASLAEDLTTLGVRSGDVLLVHSSVRALGPLVGGPVAVVQALLDAVGPAGTIVVPTQTGENSEPSEWSRPAVPPDWWPVIRAHTPAYDPARTPSKGLGILPETVRTWPGAGRSGHPQTSFAAVGARAGDVVAVHELTSALGEASPLRTLEDLDATILLLGAAWGTCTAFHLAEYRLASPVRATCSAAVLDGAGERVWVSWQDVDLDESDFPALGDALEAQEPGAVTVGTVGAASARLVGVRPALAFATGWLARHRAAPAGDAPAP